MNQVILSGRLAKEPELKTTQNGTSYLTTRIAASRNDKNKTTDFFSVKAWGKTAEFVAKYFSKGKPIEILGKLCADTYEKDGTKVTDVYVLANEVCFAPENNREKEAQPAPASEEAQPSTLPFEI